MFTIPPLPFTTAYQDWMTAITLAHAQMIAAFAEQGILFTGSPTPSYSTPFLCEEVYHYAEDGVKIWTN